MLPYYRIYCLFLALGLPLSTTFAQSPDPATTRYVSTTGTNTDPASATSWAASTSDLQGAINSLEVAGGEVWVASGLYLPTTSDGPGVSFSMRNNVAIYGGFVGNETDFGSRPSVNSNTGNPSLGTPSGSTLSGDIGIPNDNSDNSYHVIWNDGLTATAILDGFVITGGNANDPIRSTNQYGGGMFNTGNNPSCNPTIRNCLFLENTASVYGGAIYNSGNASPTLINCQFKLNTAILGGAIYQAGQRSTSSLLVTNCLFENNTVNEEGGSIYSNGEAGSCTVLLTNCSFQSNTANVGGGVSTSNGSMTAINCSFQGNTASSKGGALYTIQATSTLLNCVFWNNGNNKSIENGENAGTTASFSLFDNAVANYTATNSLTTTVSPFASTTSTQLYVHSIALDAGDPATSSAAVGTTDLAGNDRFFQGLRIDIGAYEYSLPRPVGILQQPVVGSVVCAEKTVTASVSVSGNVASYQWYKEDSAGGATALTHPASATTASLTLTDVSMASAGNYFVVVTGADNSVTSTSFSLTVNAIPMVSIAANPSLTIGFFDSATLTASGASSYSWSTGQTSTTIAVTVANTYSVTGLSNGCSSTASAVLAVTVNCGPTIYVTQNGGTTRDGTSWATAFAGTELQQAINLAAVCGVQVWVAAGIYKPTSTTDRTISFSMKPNVAIYGGFLGSETALSNRSAVDPTTGNPSSSTLSGEIGDPSSLTDNSYHIISNPAGLTTTAVLDGFVLSRGYGYAVGPVPNDRGAGIYNNGSGANQFCSPTVRNCLFQDNMSSAGGAIFNNGYQGNSSPVITSCVFQSNTANDGAAIHNSGGLFGQSNPQLTNCIFQNNLGSAGGAIHNNGNPAGTSSPHLINCSFLNNRAGGYGGALFNYGDSYSQSNPTLINCSFQSNSAYQGGAIYSNGNAGTSSPQLTNCSFQSNTASSGGGAIYGTAAYNGNSNYALTNCVVWGNNGDQAVFTQATDFPGTHGVTASYCLFDPTVKNYTATNSLTSTVSPFISATSTQLNACSPAIDAGLTSASGLTGIATDLARNERIYNSVVDMGAYEFRGTLAQFTGIIVQPVASSVVAGGSTVTAFVSVSGTGPFTYQWYKDGAAIIDQISAALSLSNTPCTSTGSYSMVVQGSCNSVTSTAFSLTVNSAVSVSITATPGLAINSLDSATLTASGASSYTWSTGQTSATIVVNTEATYSVTGVTDGCSAIASALLTVTATCNSIIHVTTGGGVSVRDGNSWATAYAGTQLQQAFERAAFCGAQVWIAAGTYKPTSNTAETNVSFSMKNGVTIYGGFVGNETVLSQRPPINPVAGRHSNTILSGDIDGDGTPARNSQHVFRHSNINSTAVMDGVVITAAYASNGNSETLRGAGMANLGSSPTLTNCTFQSNTTLVDGGAIYNKGGAPKLTNCVFDNNYAAESGGAITTSSNASIEMTNCVLQNNKASQEGGAFNLVGASIKLTNCLLQNNHADGKGGVAYGNPTFLATNCVFRANTTAEGGVFWFYRNRTTLTNCTVQGNHSTGSGGFMYNWDGAVTVLTNSILWDNGDNKGEIFYNNDTPPLATANYCLFDAASLVSGPGSFSTSTSPFVSATSSELSVCSSAIDAGDPTTTSATVGTTDLAGNNRFYNSRVDIGAYESQSSLAVAIIGETLVEGPVCLGSSTNPSVSVTGAVLSYQWYNNGTPVLGQTTAELSLSTVQPGVSGNYALVVTGACGSATSTAFNLTVNSAPVVSLGLLNNRTVLQVQSGVLYERQIVIDRVNGYEIRQTDSSTTGFFPVNRPGPFRMTVTGANGCKTVVESNTDTL